MPCNDPPRSILAIVGNTQPLSNRPRPPPWPEGSSSPRASIPRRRYPGVASHPLQSFPRLGLATKLCGLVDDLHRCRSCSTWEQPHRCTPVDVLLQTPSTHIE